MGGSRASLLEREFGLGFRNGEEFSIQKRRQQGVQGSKAQKSTVLWETAQNVVSEMGLNRWLLLRSLGV